MTAQRAYMVTVLCTGQDRFGQVRTGGKYYFSSTVSRTLSKFGLPPKPACSFLTVPRSKLYDHPKCGNSFSLCFNWRKVWTGVKWNFSSAHLHGSYVVEKLSFSRVRMCNFTRVGPKTKKLWLSMNPAQRPSEQPSLEPPQKGVNCNFPSPQFNKLSISDAYICSFRWIDQKIRKLQLF